MTPRKRKATERAGGASPAKRASKGRAAKKQDDPVWATENANSHLVNEDLHAKYCDPGTYEGWTKEDWEEIHDCLPENAPFNDDCYSVPITYFRYDPDWRRLVREFQEDLGSGRYEPQWQKEAAQAMENRAAGKFDKYKEDQFEAFWGQKQKLNAEDRAGESAKIKLADLVEAGRIRLGDDLSFRRAFEKKGEGAEGKWMIEKDIKVVDINGSSLTVIIPPGQTKYPRFQHSASPSQRKSTENADEGEIALSDIPEANGLGSVEGAYQNPSHGLSIPGVADNHPNGMSNTMNMNNSRNYSVPSSLHSNQESLVSTSDASALDSRQPNSLTPEGMMQVEVPSERSIEVKPSHEIASDAIIKFRSPSENMDAPMRGGDKSVAGKAETNRTTEKGQGLFLNKDADAIDPETGCILHQVKTIKSFVDKIIEIDGRLNPKDAPILSNWRLIRLQRNNQDLGSLFDVREEFYVWKSPNIVKMPKRGHGVGKMQVEGEGSVDLKKQTQKKDKASANMRTSFRAPRSKQSLMSTNSAGEAETRGLEDENVTESDKGAAGQADHDNDFNATKSCSTKPKPRPRAKKSPGQLQGPSNQTDDAARGGEENKGEKEALKCAIKKTHLCPHCHNGFTAERSLKRHIERYCKAISKG